MHVIPLLKLILVEPQSSAVQIAIYAVKAVESFSYEAIRSCCRYVFYMFFVSFLSFGIVLFITIFICYVYCASMGAALIPGYFFFS